MARCRLALSVWLRARRSQVRILQGAPTHLPGTAVVFVPLERAFPLRAGQRTFRFGWATDAAAFLVSHLAVQTLSFLTLLPATSLARVWQPEGLQQAVRALLLWAQFLAILVLSDLVQYWVHRACTYSTCSSRVGSCWCRSSCWDFTPGRFTPIWCSCHSMPCSSTPSCASVSAGSTG